VGDMSRKVEAQLTQLEGAERRSTPVQPLRAVVLEAIDSMRDARWAVLTLETGERTLRIEASDDLLQVSHDPYPHRQDYPDSPFWNLEGTPEATDGLSPVQSEVLTVKSADLAQHVEWTSQSGDPIAVPRRWCVLTDQAIDAVDEFLVNGEIDVDNVKWCQMEFGPAPPLSGGG
jgi:hypothetical protein